MSMSTKIDDLPGPMNEDVKNDLSKIQDDLRNGQGDIGLQQQQQFRYTHTAIQLFGYTLWFLIAEGRVAGHAMWRAFAHLRGHSLVPSSSRATSMWHAQGSQTRERRAQAHHSLEYAQHVFLVSQTR